MKNGLYKCTHCGHIGYRTTTGKNKNGVVMGVRCEQCQFDTMQHESWWMQGANIVVGAQEEYFAQLRKEFDSARS